MAITCKLINAVTGWVLNKDSDIQAPLNLLLTEGVINDADTSNFEVTAGQVWSGKCFIEVTRTNTSPEEKWLAYVWNQSDESKTLWNNKKIYIYIPQANINDNTLNTESDWTLIASIEVEDAYPVTWYYIPLAETDWVWAITDLREFAKIKWANLNSVSISILTGWTWKAFYTDWNWDMQEISLWVSWTVFWSNWVSSPPWFISPTISIPLLDEKLSITSGDKMLVYDATSWVNKQHEAKASTTNEWLVERATDTESLDLTDETRYINSKQSWIIVKWYAFIPVTWTTYTYNTANTETSHTGDTDWTLLKEIRVDIDWVFDTTFDLRGVDTNWGETYDGRIYINWVATWTSHTVNSWAWDSWWITKTDSNLTVSRWDLVQVYAKTRSTIYSNTVYVRNFQIKYDKAFQTLPTELSWEVILD